MSRSDPFAAHTEGKDAAAVELLHQLAKVAEGAAADVETKVSPAQVAWRRRRNFLVAYVKGRYLEIALDLTREVAHPKLRAAFATTKSVTTHRLTLTDGDRIDARLRGWIEEAARKVGPGLRRTGRPNA